MENSFENIETSIARGNKTNYTFPFIVITTLFFLWGFMTAMNDILIPYLKKLFVLNYAEATLVQFVFFGAYFLGSLIYFLASLSVGDLIAKIGYKNGLVFGLILSGIGCLLFIPASALGVYGLFLGAFFCLGLGFTLLQIAANPYVLILGSPQSASSRLNLSQGFNSIGTTIAPLIGARLIFGNIHTGAIGVDMLKNMYLVLGFIFFATAAIIKLIRLPGFKSEGKVEKEAGALRSPALVMGVLAIFSYCGGEVTIGSLLISFLKLPQIAGMSDHMAGHYLAFYWGGLMIGRFLGAVSLRNEIPYKSKMIIMLGISILSLCVIISLTDFNTAAIYSVFVGVNYLCFLFGRSLPGRTLGIFALIVAILLAMAIICNGYISMWCLLGIGLFNSIMWSNIFALAISKLGKYTTQGSSLLIMAILGAAVIPVLQGTLADRVGLQVSFIVPLFCYLYLIYYGFTDFRKRSSLIHVNKRA